ncbi:hypothetical protein ACSFBX_27355 [Variovorax sp. RB2P76]|uniref:hypothetical protein n=1 Tax=Variovorax sp. RB2P76 TaxID=3443736 RepID=UPI003F45DDE4
MYIPGKYTVVAHAMAEVPAKALLPYGPFKLVAVRQQIAERFGGSVSEMFPEFARDFPLTVASMQAHWSKPMLALRDGAGWHATLFLEQETLNLFFASPFPVYADEPYFDVSMLPPRWIGLYRSMESFCITEQSYYSPLGWRNTPLPRGMGIDGFSTETNTKKAKLKAFAKQLDIKLVENHLRCWMLTDAHDSLWIDHQHCDRKVYHVHADAFADAYALPDPGATLDRYLAHVVAGGSPKDFEFREAN